MMLPIDGAVVSLETAWIWNWPLRTAQVGDAQHRSDVFAADSGDRSPGGKEDLVVTPGGPRPRDQTHHVGPGETIRRNDDGTYTVVPKESSDGPKPNEEREDKQK